MTATYLGAGSPMMPILTLLNRIQAKNATASHPVVDRKPRMRISYLTGLAMQAHADGILDREEKFLFLQVAREFNISDQEALEILDRAKAPEEKTIEKIREHLLHSKYKYYFILDLQIMAHQDREVCSVESAVIKRFGDLLDIDRDDVAFLVDLADAVVEEDLEVKKQWVNSFFSGNPISDETQPEDFNYYTSEVTKDAP